MSQIQPPFSLPCKWAANPPEHWDCITHGGTAEDPLDLGRPCQKRMDLALAEIERLSALPAHDRVIIPGEEYDRLLAIEQRAISVQQGECERDCETAAYIQSGVWQ